LRFAFIVALNTMLQRRTPGHLMGRVSTASDVVLGMPQALWIALGALLVNLISYRSIYWICAAVLLLAAGYLVAALRGADTSASTVAAEHSVDA
jgi:MFS family permease